jgi:hypothetical protein
MKNPIIKHGTVTRIGELLDADNKTYGEETRERNARHRKWGQPVQARREFYREPYDLPSGSDATIFVFFFCVGVAALSKLLALIV